MQEGYPVAPFHCAPGLHFVLCLALTGRLDVWGDTLPRAARSTACPGLWSYTLAGRFRNL